MSARPRSSDPAENPQERRAKRRAVPFSRESDRVRSHPDITYADCLVGRASYGESGRDDPIFYGECADHPSVSHWREIGLSAGAATAEAVEHAAAT
jgi:hypothetical protein